MGKAPVRELISGFNGCIRPGELLLVLGRPGSGCSTFLKALCNQRSGFEAVEGNVTYGGTSAEEMAKRFRGEVIYNPEDAVHYATLSVRTTLSFAIQTRTSGKETRLEGETREDYVTEFLRVVSKLFWIEHTRIPKSATSLFMVSLVAKENALVLLRQWLQERPSKAGTILVKGPMPALR